jgi:putative membrane protein
MRTSNNWAMACAVAFALASAVPAVAQSGGSGQSGSGSAMDSGQSGTMSGAGGSGQTGSTAPAGQGNEGRQVGRDNPQADLQKFVENAALSNMAEIQLGQLAQQKAQDPEVKQFAQTMIDAHTKAQSELQQAASASGLAVPSSLDSKHQKIHDKLSNLNGAAFDKQYLKVMVDAHNDARKLLEKRAGKQNANASYRGSGSDIGGTGGTAGASGTAGTSGTATSGTTGTSGTSGTGVETGTSSTSGMTSASASGAAAIDSWAATTLPDVQHHLQMAKDLEKRVRDAGKASKNDKNDK